MKKRLIILLFALIVLLDIYLNDFRINIIIQFCFLAFLLTQVSGISLKILKTILPLLGIMGLGFVLVVFENYDKTNIIKDVLYFSRPILGILIGAIVYKIIDDGQVFLKVVIYIALITAIVHLTEIFVFSKFSASSISTLRNEYGLDNFIEIFAFFIIAFMPKDDRNINFSKAVYYSIYGILLCSILFYFSRTMYIVLLVGVLSMKGYFKFNKRSLKIIGALILVTLLFFAYLFSLKLDRNSKGLEGLLYKIKMTPGEIFNAKIDRQNHAQLWDHWRAYEAKRAFSLMENHPGSYVAGTGFGSMIDLRFKAPLGDKDMRYISRIHNGYVFVFYKTGFLGIVALLIFLSGLYSHVYYEGDDEKLLFSSRIISTIGIFYFFTSLVITGIYIPRDSVIFLLGGFLTYRMHTTKRPSAVLNV